MPGLIMRRGPKPGVRFPLSERLILGRHRSADVVLEDAGASRRHAAVISRPDGYRIIDLGSTNGTLLNGKVIRGEALLADGDLIGIGNEVMFEFVAAEGAPSGVATGTNETVPVNRSGNGKQDPSASLPRTLGKFVLLSHLGRGGMGDVYRARERDGGPEVALKLIRTDIGNREAFLDFFHNREAVLAREIDHPNIIRVFEHGVMGDQHFLVMEYVGGESLQETLRGGPLSMEETLEILRQLACGLQAAHRRGVVHSDVKPANIMVLRSGREGSARSKEGPESTAVGDRGRVLLEFPDADDAPRPRYDEGLKEEIRRRLASPAQDMLLDAPYLPRPSEMRFLLHYWEGLRESGGYFVLVEGEPGTGKDRLLSEFLKEAGLEASVGALFVPAPGKLFELDVSRIEGIPRLHERIFPDRAPVDHPGRETVEEILKALEAESEPAVVRVLGLEHASILAGELLEGLARLLAERPILVLASLDTGRQPANGILRQLLRAAGARAKSLYLRPLSEYQVARYLQELFREPDRNDRLAADLHRLSGGNMEKLLETLRGFFSRGVLRREVPSGRMIYQLSQKELELEEGKGFYEKYRKYGRTEARTLERAAFIGAELPFDALQRFSEVDETALFFILRDLVAQGFLVESSRAWYRFTNEAFRRYISNGISPRERARLHRKVAWLLDETDRTASPGLLALRAYHWEGAGEPAKATGLLLEAARLARIEYDADAARRMYQEILRLWRSLAGDEPARRAVNEELRRWFRRDANWYEVLGSLGETPVRVQVKITDFGISFRVEEEVKVEGPIPLGTPRYLAPERVRRDQGGPKSDIFALGIIAYEMIAGEPPFPKRKGLEAMRANLLEEIPDPRPREGRLPPGFLELFRGMVEKDPDLRWDAERVLRTMEWMQLDLVLGEKG